MNIDLIYHFPPDLMNLLIDTIPRLNRGKEQVFLFFRGAGVPESILKTPYQQWQVDKSISKYEIVRSVLAALNDAGELHLRTRREIVKRVVEFESFSSCWPNDELLARGLVGEVQKVVNIKDSFTRMKKERDEERQMRMARVQSEREQIRIQQEAIDRAKTSFYALFAEYDKKKRGKALEAALNDLFTAHGILVREAFTRCGDFGEGIVEQIDGVVEIDCHLYFVEMKWWESPLGVPEISEHLVRVYARPESRAIVISGSDFTAPAVAICKDANREKIVILCTLQELVTVLESSGDMTDFIRKKSHHAQIEKNPYFRIGV